MNEISAEKSKLDDLVSSEFHYYFGRYANLALVLFFLAQPLNWSPWSYSVSWQKFVGLFVVGYFVWTFVEYVMHRWLYHEIQSLMAKGHGMHHDDPEGLLGMPWIVNTVVILLIFAGIAWLFPRAESGVFLGAFWLGYLNYTLIHHGMHHWKFKNYVFKSLWRHHKVHHKMPDKNLGVSTSFWDYVFRTKV